MCCRWLVITFCPPFLFKLLKLFFNWPGWRPMEFRQKLQTVQAALPAKQVFLSAAQSTLFQLSLSAANSISAMPPCFGGIPESLPSLASLASSAASLLAAGTGFGGHSVPGRPSQSFVVPSFVSTFSLLYMLSFASNSTNVCLSQIGMISDVGAHSVCQPASFWTSLSTLVPVSCPCLRSLLLSELLAVNLLQKESDPQLLFDSALFLRINPKRTAS